MGDGPRKEADRLKSPVARILLANYKVIGKLFRGKTRLAALFLITSNKRYSPPRFLFPSLSLSISFFLSSFSIFFFSFWLPLVSLFRSTRSVFHFIPLPPLLLTFFLSFDMSLIFLVASLKRSILSLHDVTSLRNRFISRIMYQKTDIDHFQSGRESNGCCH